MQRVAGIYENRTGKSIPADAINLALILDYKSRPEDEDLSPRSGGETLAERQAELEQAYGAEEAAIEKLLEEIPLGCMSVK